MSHRVRQSLPIVVILVMVLAGLARAGSDDPSPLQDTELEPFPARIIATAPPLPQYADGAWTRIRQHVASLNAMWSTAFAAAGDEYEPPTILQNGDADCGQMPGGWAGLYCPAKKSIVVDIDGHVRRHQGIGQGVSDQILGYILAHELGHHVQSLRGASHRPTLDIILRRELHADCLAGVWGKASGTALPPVWMYGEDAEHGTAQQRIRWLNVGYLHARPADCDAIFADGAAV